MSMGKRARKNGNEQDAFGKWGRKYLCALQRAGVVKATKQIANRRDRRTTRQELDFDYGDLGCPPGCTSPFCDCPGTR
jgi:hypothetical protein